MKAPIHSEKHISQFTGGAATVGAAAATNFELVKGVAVANKNLVKEVTEGSIVKAIFIELWVSAQNSTAVGNFIVTLEKTNADGPGASYGQMIILNDYPNKKNILYTTEGLSSPEFTAAPIPVLRSWMKIPKGKQRFGLGDILVLTVASQTVGVNVCGFAVFKEYS